MSCYGPLYGYYSRDVNASGKRSITFSKLHSHTGIKIVLPCGKCIGCVMKWRREWALRILHEKRMHRESAFLTLTYADDRLPAPPSLRLHDLQRFMYRLRKVRPRGVRFFACGEYGDTTHRPHYHVLLLNTCFPDQRPRKSSGSGEMLYQSAELSKLWPDGQHWIGNVTERSAAYVAGYVTKKVGQPDRPSKFFEREFRVMSRRPGIGTRWYDTYHREAYIHDNCIMNEHEVPLPRYYDGKLLKECTVDAAYMMQRKFADKTRLEEVKRERWRKRMEDKAAHPEEYTKQRLMVREGVDLAKANFFKRDGSS